jgi:FtsZ-interacting cell division protein ZipA
MGRHSAPDDEDVVAKVATADAAADPGRGRHAAQDDAQLGAAQAELAIRAEQLHAEWVKQEERAEAERVRRAEKLAAERAGKAGKARARQAEKDAAEQAKQAEREAAERARQARKDAVEHAKQAERDEAERVRQAELTAKANAKAAKAARTAQKRRPPVGRGNQSTAQDIALLRARPDVRNRVIAAAIVPFVLYAVVLLLTGGIDVILIWAWVPFVTAGVLAGSIVDAAHRKRSRGRG